MATREQWRERLLGFELPAEVVDTFLATIKDDDLVRMKEYDKEEFMALLKEAIKEPEATTKQDKKPDEEETDEEKKKRLEAEAAAACKEDDVVSKIIKAIGEKEFTVEVPELAQIQTSLKDLTEVLTIVKDLSERVKALEGTMKEATQLWKDLGEDDTVRLRGMVKNLSPAQRARLSQSVAPEDALLRIAQQVKDRFVSPDSAADGIVIKDGEGNVYKNMGDMAAGRPIEKHQ